MKTIVTFILVAFVMACSPVSLATKAISSLAGGDYSGIAVDTRIAKEANDSIVLGENSRTDIKAELVNITEIVNKNYSTGLLLLAVLGWVLPTPSRMGKSLWKYFTNRRKRKE